MARDWTSADDDELVRLPSIIAVTSDDEDAVEIRTLLMTRDGGTVDGSASAVLATSQGPVDLDAGIDGGFPSIDVAPLAPRVHDSPRLRWRPSRCAAGSGATERRAARHFLACAAARTRAARRARRPPPLRSSPEGWPHE